MFAQDWSYLSLLRAVRISYNIGVIWRITTLRLGQRLYAYALLQRVNALISGTTSLPGQRPYSRNNVLFLWNNVLIGTAPLFSLNRGQQRSNRDPENGSEARLLTTIYRTLEITSSRDSNYYLNILKWARNYRAIWCSPKFNKLTKFQSKSFRSKDQSRAAPKRNRITWI